MFAHYHLIGSVSSNLLISKSSNTFEAEKLPHSILHLGPEGHPLSLSRWFCSLELSLGSFMGRLGHLSDIIDHQPGDPWIHHGQRRKV